MSGAHIYNNNDKFNINLNVNSILHTTLQEASNQITAFSTYTDTSYENHRTVSKRISSLF